MHNITKISTVAIAMVVAAAPAHALAPRKEASAYGTVAQYVKLGGRNFSDSYIDPNPTLYNPYEPTFAFSVLETDGGNNSDAYNRAKVEATAVVGFHKISAVVATNAFYGFSAGNDNPVFAAAQLNVSTTDRITFSGIRSGSPAILAITSVARVKLETLAMINGIPRPTLRTSNFSYTSESILYDSASDVTSETAGPKATSGVWRTCNGTLDCQPANYLKNGFRISTNYFSVDNDDVLYIDNNLSLGGSVKIFGATNACCIQSLEQRNDFGHTGYTLLNFVTPGASYHSLSGESYFTSVPGGIPEPASWAMLIAGFGLTGAAMRRSRQRAHSVAA
jgi:hypothetical protein